MDCRELDTLLYPYLDGELVEGDRVRLESHLAACDGCREKMAKEGAVLHLIRARAREAGVTAPEGLRTRLQSALHHDARRSRARNVARITAAAAGIAVCAVAGNHQWRTWQRQRYVQDAASRHAKAYPMEINRPTPEQLEAWFSGKLDHRVAVPRFANAVTQGGRLLNVRDRQAAYVRLTAAGNRNMGLFVYGDKAGDVDVSEPDFDNSNGFNVVTWRDGDVVYQLVTDLDERDIREMLPAPPRAGPMIQPASFRH